MLKKVLSLSVIISGVIFLCGLKAEAAVELLSISDAQFQQMMKEPSAGVTAYWNQLKVAQLLLKKGCEKYPELQKEVTGYLENVNNIVRFIIAQDPGKKKKIAKLEAKCRDYNLFSIPRYLSRMIPYDKWSDSKLRGYYRNCAKYSDKIERILQEKKSSLPEYSIWEKHILEQRKKAALTADSSPIKNIIPDKTDYNDILKALVEGLKSSNMKQKKQNIRLAKRFLNYLNRRIISVAIVEVQQQQPPQEMRAEALKERSQVMMRNLDDAVILMYGNSGWGKVFRKEYGEISKRINQQIKELPAVKKKREWYDARRKKLISMKDELMKDSSNPHVAKYLNAKKILQPYIEKK